MYTNEKLLEMLKSKKTSVRYEACEWIRVSQESSSEIVIAIEKATHDVDKEVAQRAELALQADVHHQMAINMGMIEPDNDKNIIVERMNTENKEVKAKSYRIWGWILGIAGGLFMLLGILSFMMMVGASYHEIFEVGLVCFPPSIILGIPLLILSYRIINSKRNMENSRIWGWFSLILGAFFVLSSIWVDVGVNLFYSQQIEFSMILFIVIGILLVIPGIWLLTSKREMSSSTPGNSNDPQE